MASYNLLQALSGARYDAVKKVLHMQPPMSGDFRSFLSTAADYGTVGVRDGKPFFEAVHGTVAFREIRYVSPVNDSALTGCKLALRAGLSKLAWPKYQSCNGCLQCPSVVCCSIDGFSGKCRTALR